MRVPAPSGASRCPSCGSTDRHRKTFCPSEGDRCGGCELWCEDGFHDQEPE